MALVGKHYVFRAGDKPADDIENVCLFDDAAVALACALGDVDLAARAKRVVSSLWENTTKPPYTEIFPRKIDADTVWRASQILQSVNEAITQLRSEVTGRSKTILSHGNRFILYRVFKTPELKQFRNPKKDLSMLKNQAKTEARSIGKLLCQILTTSWQDETIQYVFKYVKKCRQLDELCDQNGNGKPALVQSDLF